MRFGAECGEVGFPADKFVWMRWRGFQGSPQTHLLWLVAGGTEIGALSSEERCIEVCGRSLDTSEGHGLI
jgi:hypothetical protein